jgi:hypothetical protein
MRNVGTGSGGVPMSALVCAHPDAQIPTPNRRTADVVRKWLWQRRL